MAKLSVFGVGMKSHTSVASRLFQSLAAEGINVDLISTTEVRINVMVDGRHGEKARAALLAGIRQRNGVEGRARVESRERRDANACKTSSVEADRLQPRSSALSSPPTRR